MKRFMAITGMICCGIMYTNVAQSDEVRVEKLDEIVVSSTKIETGQELDKSALSAKTSYVTDTARMLQDVPGVFVYTAGGVSSLPVVHGLSDDRLRIKVDGMDLVSSCPNHMNSPLSYVDPTNVSLIKVTTGITPVSMGGDSIGASIIAVTREPEFAAEGQKYLVKGEAGGRYQSNGNFRGTNAGLTFATEHVSITYNGSYAKSGNYTAGGNFKNYFATGNSTYSLALDEVGSSAYQTQNHAVGLAYKQGANLFEVQLGYQNIPEELYPNQRMDMLDNIEKRVNARHLGQFDWGNLETRIYFDRVDHYMDFGEDKKFFYGAPPALVAPGMPMYTKGQTFGGSMKSEINVSKKDQVRVGYEMQLYRLDDWWPPSPNCGVGVCVGGMAPLTFWNMNGGTRDRYGIYGEWESQWNKDWLTLVGLRTEMVITETGQAIGYNTSTTPLNTGFMKNMYETSSVGTRADFNATDRNRRDYNFDWVASVRYTPTDTASIDFGFSQKTRSPNLYERYSWSRNSMALEMNNFVGDGNGYLGDPYLKPETAYTVTATADWHSTDRAWGVKVIPYYTHVNDYIDAVQWNRTTNLPAIPLTSNQFVTMKYVNQSARIFGIDLSGQMPLGSTAAGNFGLKGFVSYTNGKNNDTGYALYNVMPFTAKGVVTHSLNGWENSLEAIGVVQKHNVSVPRNELQTPGYALFNFRTSYTWKNLRFDCGVENMFNQLYYQPLGGAYTGQGATMSFNREIGTIGPNGGTTSMWGTAVPGMGRSFYAGLNLKF